MDALSTGINPWLGTPTGFGGGIPSVYGSADARLLGGAGALGGIPAFNPLAQAGMYQAAMSRVIGLLSDLMRGQGGAANAGGSTPADTSGGSSGSSGGASGSSGTSGTSGGGGVGTPPGAGQPSESEAKDFIKKAAGAYGADAGVLEKIAQKESSFKADAVNKTDSNAQKGTPSKGMFQFIDPTFKDMAPKAKAANPQAWEGLGELNWMDWRQQALTAAWAIKNGKGSHWSTYKAAGGT